MTATLVPGLQLQVEVGLARAARRTRSMLRGSIDDQPRALAQAALHARGEHRVAVGRVGADHHDTSALSHRIEVLRAGRLAERLLQAVAGRRVADARAGVDVVVAEAAARTSFCTR
jgi:hypothetical protein